MSTSPKRRASGGTEIREQADIMVRADEEGYVVLAVGGLDHQLHLTPRQADGLATVLLKVSAHLQSRIATHH